MLNLQINWNPDPVMFDLVFLQLRWYGVMWALAIITGYYLTFYLFKKKGMDTDKTRQTDSIYFNRRYYRGEIRTRNVLRTGLLFSTSV